MNYPKKQLQQKQKNPVHGVYSTHPKQKNPDTSWNGVSVWYDDLLQKEDSYQQKVILPNLSRILSLSKQDLVLDLACGQGFFSGEILAFGIPVVGIDLAPSLIARAKELYPQGEFLVGDADNLSFLPSAHFTHCIHISAIQNIQNVGDMLAQVYRSLVPGGICTIVMNHPTFRIPRESDWGYETTTGEQYRKIYRYMSERKVEIDMNPGEQDMRKKKYTTSFHRPLQWYMKIFLKAGFQITRFEEWVSHKESGVGPKKQAEDIARKEIPLFLCIQLQKPAV